MKEGEIVKYDFEVYADDTLIATTIKELALENEIEVEEHIYEPQFSISGMDGPFPGIKEAIMAGEKDGEAEFEVPAKEAFGERNPRNLDYRRFADIARIAQKQEKDIDRGVKLEIDGRIATITLVTPARVRIDYNHEYAGMKVLTKVKILDTPTERDDVVRAILEMNVGSSEEFEFSEDDGILSITVPSGISLGFEWSTLKLRIVTQLRKHTGIKNIRYIEDFFQKTETLEEPEITVEAGDGSSDEEPAAESEKDEQPETADEKDEQTEAETEETKAPVAEELPPEDYKAEPKEGDAGSDAAVAEPEEE